MKRNALFLCVLLLAACSGGHSGVTAVPGHGAVAVQVVPNPIVASLVSGSTYTFPFDVVVRETGGRPIHVTRVSATVFAPGGLTLGRESWDASQIQGMGFNTQLGANGEARYHFAPRKDVPDERLFGGVSAELRVEAVDDSGTATNASTVVTITR
ncbi:MAG: hypothetical protein JO197_00625 [Acidobacteria bacterium]|nr:hypothetical protein [Acidobacteriota bacterium]MBV9476382.1 hypothetical protein [Acidobacteriota bacterium]